ncbi:unnamed protein product [Vicia faba]|uniref:Glutaredoxin-like protein n=1 Tax=Vicia faba TaxID=3906 RepID=A0AAV0ZHL9_VICFA|nr:unnamed protein product [Vicia faba]
MATVARAVAVLAVARTSTVLPGGGNSQRLLKFKPLCSSSSPSSRKLVLYSKPGCCLCDGLKEKLQAAFLLSGPHSLSDVDLQIRDITTNPEWDKAYQYEIPVLAKVLSDGTEETLPRLSPRLGVELLQKKIAAALGEQ